MNCPVDGTELRITDREGIEIDYRPQCRGIWLDRGELDKVLERSTRMAAVGERDRDRYRDDDRPYRERDSRVGAGAAALESGSHELPESGVPV